MRARSNYRHRARYLPCADLPPRASLSPCAMSRCVVERRSSLAREGESAEGRQRQFATKAVMPFAAPGMAYLGGGCCGRAIIAPLLSLARTHPRRAATLSLSYAHSLAPSIGRGAAVDSKSARVFEVVVWVVFGARITVSGGALPCVEERALVVARGASETSAQRRDALSVRRPSRRESPRLRSRSFRSLPRGGARFESRRSGTSLVAASNRASARTRSRSLPRAPRDLATDRVQISYIA